MSSVSGATKPPALALQFDQIPAELTIHHRWVTWNWSWEPGKPGEPGKWTKPLYNVRTGKLASSTEPETWSTFEEAMIGYERGGWDGIGLVLGCERSPLDVIGLDLDDAIDPGGNIHPEALRIVREINSYTERSPSGRGLRIFTKGQRLPEGWRKTRKFTFPIELYDSGRYLTVTGHHIEGTPQRIEARTAEVAALHARIRAVIDSGNGHHAPTSAPEGESIPGDDTLLEHARHAHNGGKFSQLWTGDTSAHGGDDSAADLALCAMLAFWTARDAARMDRLFRRSGLMRPKWDAQRGAQTYGARTIAAAINACCEVYTPRPAADRGEPPPKPRPASGDGWPLYDGAEDWDFPGIAELVESLLPATGIVWWGGLPKRYKSLFALYCSLALACRRSSVAKKFLVRAFPKILYVAREDGGPRLKDRRNDILSAWTERPEPGAIIFVIRPRLDLLNPEHIAWLRETCTRLGITMLVLDTWTALSPSADPLGTKDQAQLSAVVVRLCEDIAGLVVVVDHSRKNRPDGQALSSADIFGPPQKWAAAEHIVMLDVVEAGRRLEVFIEGKDMETRRFFLAVSPRGSGEEKFTFAGSVDDVADAQRAVGDRNRKAILDLLPAAVDQALSTQTIHEQLTSRGLTLSKDTIQRHIKRLLSAGAVLSIGTAKDLRYFAGSPGLPQAPSAAQEDLRW